MQCQQCGTVFYFRSTMSRVSQILVLLLIAPSAVALVGYFIYLLWDFFTSSS